MCIGFLNKFTRRLKDREVQVHDKSKTELELLKACEGAKGKEERFVSTVYCASNYDIMYVIHLLKSLQPFLHVLTLTVQ